MSQAFPILSRLKAPADFQKVWKTGKRVSVPLLTIVCCDNPLGYARLGISLPKKFIRLASSRNRLKRLARETFRVRLHKLGSKDIVIVAYKGADALDAKAQYERFNSLWDQYIARFVKA